MGSVSGRAKDGAALGKNAGMTLIGRSFGLPISRKARASARNVAVADIMPRQTSSITSSLCEMHLISV